MPTRAALAPLYAYDATPSLCHIGIYDAIYDYDVTRCAHSITSSTTVTTTFHGDAGFEGNGGWLSGPAVGGGDERESADSGMSLYGYRYYNPDIGRWVNSDPPVE